MDVWLTKTTYNCFYLQEPIGAMWGWCTLEPDLNPKWQLSWYWQFQGGNHSSLIFVIVLMAFSINMFIIIWPLSTFWLLGGLVFLIGYSWYAFCPFFVEQVSNVQFISLWLIAKSSINHQTANQHLYCTETLQLVSCIQTMQACKRTTSPVCVSVLYS